jgi:hypothetical protein
VDGHERDESLRTLDLTCTCTSEKNHLEVHSLEVMIKATLAGAISGTKISMNMSLPHVSIQCSKFISSTLLINDDPALD